MTSQNVSIPDRPVVCLRMDDVGASSKFFERHGRTRLDVGGFKVPFPGNFWFLKSIKPIRRWGPYAEMTVADWHRSLRRLADARARMTVAVTAGWVEENGTVTPFDRKYPEQMRVIREGVASGLIEIANHGLTHCVVEDGKFLIPFWRDNRRFHREFRPEVPDEVHRDHLHRAQDILESAFGVRPVTFVPPGHMYSAATLEFALEAGLSVLSCGRPPASETRMRYVPEADVVAFHDRELVLEGTDWLVPRLAAAAGRPFVFVRDLAGIKERT